MSPRTSVVTLAILGALLHAAPCSAVSCDELKTEVEAKIRARGVTAFSVAVVDAGAVAPGKVVGTCEHAAKKLTYTQTAATAPPTSAPTKTGKKADLIITECRDGSEPVRGECKKQ